MIMIILLILIIITIIYPNTSKISLYPQLSFPAASHHCSHHPRRMCWPGWMVTGGSPRGCMQRWPLRPTPTPGEQVPSTHRPLQTFFPRPMKNKDGYTTWACGYFSQVMTTTMMTIAKMTTVATMIMKMSWWWHLRRSATTLSSCTESTSKSLPTFGGRSLQGWSPIIIGVL